MRPTSLTTVLSSPVLHIRKWSLKEMDKHRVPRPLRILSTIMPLASWTTMSTIPLERVACLRKCSLEEKQMDVCKSSFKIILGSSSMARRRILAEMGYEFSIVTADIDEKSIRKDKPEELVMSLAHAKADAIIARLQTTGQLEEDARATLLITADTVVVYKGIVREKPTSREEARNFIKGYSSDSGAVVGSVLVINLKTGIRKGAWERAEVLLSGLFP
ncbi:7-methyl-GTP pyrophosphatase isoform X4 [Jatropha curcas]|uniref:7-methyl-GTP pyrophosphatase isoform X4 n=1 Tax=Jatropha curcas TaxID=180498 RepID=UPI0009D790DB|nr:7-methyl-GTP pyrophosphatase isoform X4 [Jatropha curcas]